MRLRPRRELALDLIDEVRAWGLEHRLVLADSVYGDSYKFREGLRNEKWITLFGGRGPDGMERGSSSLGTSYETRGENTSEEALC